MQVSTIGMADERIIFLMFFIRSVPVMAATRLALEEIGEHLSPQKAPARTAPAVIGTLTPPLRARIIITTPIVPAVPKELPRMRAIKQVMRKAHRIKREGAISFVPQ